MEWILATHMIDEVSPIRVRIRVALLHEQRIFGKTVSGGNRPVPAGLLVECRFAQNQAKVSKWLNQVCCSLGRKSKWPFLGSAKMTHPEVEAGEIRTFAISTTTWLLLPCHFSPFPFKLWVRHFARFRKLR